MFSLQLVDRLLEGALGLLDLGLAFRDIELCDDKSESTSAILRLAVSAAACCFELSSLKIGAPFSTWPLNST